MKLSLLRENLFAGLQIVSRAVSTRSTLPSLGGIELDAAGSSLTLRATDMELGLTMVLQEVQVESEGTVLLPGRLLGDVVRSLPPGEVTLELRPEQRDVELTASAARFHLRTLPAEDFPCLPELERYPVALGPVNVESLEVPAHLLNPSRGHGSRQSLGLDQLDRRVAHVERGVHVATVACVHPGPGDVKALSHLIDPLTAIS